MLSCEYVQLLDVDVYGLFQMEGLGSDLGLAIPIFLTLVKNVTGI